MNEKQKIPIDFERTSRIFGKIMKVLEKKTKDNVEALLVLKFGVAFYEISMGVVSSDDSEIRDFIREMMKEGSDDL